jgi:membrane associated rhomboid family serine protease
VRAPVELRRPPVVTAIVFTVTAATGLAQLVVPGMLADLERTPAELHGQPWRMATALLVQDGGVVGSLSNLAFLAIVGAAAEQLISRPRWLLHYLGVALAAELVGAAWQPVGGGNSIAVCGLTGAVALALWRGDERVPAFAAPALMLWCGALLGTISTAVAIPAIIAGAVAVRLVQEGRRRGVAVDRLAAAAVPVVAVVLTADKNIHGAALLLGLAFAFVTSAEPRPAHARRDARDAARS